MGEENTTLQRVALGGQVKWKDGEFLVWNIPGMNLPMYTYIDFIKTLKEHSKDCNRILYSMGEKQAIIAADFQKTRFGTTKQQTILTGIIEQIPLLGFGNMEALSVNFEKGKAMFKNVKSPFARYYKRLFGFQKEPVDAHICGVLAGVLEAITNRKLCCIETACVAQGKAQCVFEVMSKENVPRHFKHIDYSSTVTIEHIRKQVKRQKPIVVNSKRL